MCVIYINWAIVGSNGDFLDTSGIAYAHNQIADHVDVLARLNGDDAVDVDDFVAAEGLVGLDFDAEDWAFIATPGSVST